MQAREGLGSWVLASTLILGSLAAVAAPSAARAEFYAGGSVGRVGVEVDELDDFDESDTAVKVIVGYIIDLPVVDFSVEGSYVDFGSASDDVLGAELDFSGLDAFAVVGLDFGIIGAFAKAGVISWDVDASFAGVEASDDGTDPAYGIGVRFNLGSLFIRAEYERFDIDTAGNADLDMLSAGVVWRF